MTKEELDQFRPDYVEATIHLASGQIIRREFRGTLTHYEGVENNTSFVRGIDRATSTVQACAKNGFWDDYVFYPAHMIERCVVLIVDEGNMPETQSEHL